MLIFIDVIYNNACMELKETITFKYLSFEPPLLLKRSNGKNLEQNIKIPK